MLAAFPPKRRASRNAATKGTATDRFLLLLGRTSTQHPWTVVACTLISEEFVGSVVTLFLEADGGAELKAQIQQRQIENLDMQSGARLYLSWPTASVHVLPD